MSKVHITLGPETQRILKEMIKTGLFGKSVSLVAGDIINRWVWDNQEKLAAQGIRLWPISLKQQKLTIEELEGILERLTNT